MKPIIFIFVAFLPVISSVKTCFEPYGCYTLDSPWHSIPSRPFALLPKAPHIINTRFLLYTKLNSEEVELVINKTGILTFSDFDSSKKTRVIVHGFMASGADSWVAKLRDQLFINEECNVIIVEWGDGAGLPYMQAVANARVVGDQLVHLLQFINRAEEQSFSDMHIIGHGVGAHIAGYAGKKINKLGRITGLDPAQPYFSGSNSIVRLDSADASFVDVVHTDGSTLLHIGFGMDQALGHVDFYPNEGKSQPGCSLLDKIKGSIWDAVRLNLIGSAQALACEHLRAIDLFIESINTKCPYLAFKCADAKSFNSGSCTKCKGDSCTRFGFHSDKFPARGTMYLTTNGKSPFCHYSFLTSVTTASKQVSTTGEIYAKVTGRSGMTEQYKVNSESQTVSKGATYSNVGIGKLPIGDIRSVALTYKDTSLLFKKDLFVDKVFISSVDKDLKFTEYKFCAPAIKVGHGSTVKMDTPC